MAQAPASHGLIVTVGFVVLGERYQWVIPYLASGALDPDNSGAEVLNYFESDVYPAWKAIATMSQYVDGIQVEGMAESAVMPQRKVYGTTDYVGTIEDEPTPPQTSIVVAYYSLEQLGAVGRTKVGKTFVGPASQAKTEGGIITDAGYLSDIDSLADKLKGPFTGPDSGLDYSRSMGRSSDPLHSLYIADRRSTRRELFTQKRRMVPLF